MVLHVIYSCNIHLDGTVDVFPLLPILGDFRYWNSGTELGWCYVLNTACCTGQKKPALLDKTHIRRVIRMEWWIELGVHNLQNHTRNHKGSQSPGAENLNYGDLQENPNKILPLWASVPLFMSILARETRIFQTKKQHPSRLRWAWWRRWCWMMRSRHSSIAQRLAWFAPKRCTQNMEHLPAIVETTHFYVGNFLGWATPAAMPRFPARNSRSC